MRTVAWGAALGLMAAGGPALAQMQREIIMDNQCEHPIRLLIEHADGDRNWHPHAWFEIAPFESTSLVSDQNVVLTQTDNHELYFYAEATDGSGIVWEGTASQVQWEGVTYSLALAQAGVSGGDLWVTLTCA